MSTFVLIHGAASSGWDWHLVARKLRELGHTALAPDMPAADESADVDDYVDTVVEAVGDQTDDDLVVVAHSLGGLYAPLVCQRIPARLLVLVTAMIPRPGESGVDWWVNTGHDEATKDDDYTDDERFLHDVPDALAAEARRQTVHQARTPLLRPWPGESWPDVPTRFLLCRDDRLFPADWMRDLVRTRLGIVPDEIDGGHYVALSRPVELAHRLHGYVASPAR